MKTIPRDLIFGIIIFGIILMGGVSLISIFGEKNSAYINDDMFGTFNTTSNTLMQDINTKVSSINSSIGSDTVDPGLFGFLDKLVNTGWNTIKLLGDTLSFADKAYYAISDSLGIPSWIMNSIILLIIVVIIFSVLSAVFQKDV